MQASMVTEARPVIKEAFLYRAVCGYGNGVQPKKQKLKFYSKQKLN